MLSRSNRILLLACCFLPGCTNANSVAVGPNGPSRKSNDAPPLAGDFDFDLNDSTAVPGEVQDALTGLDREFSKELLLNTPRGSQVSLVDESGHRYIGTLLSADAQGVELMNSVCRETVPGPNGQMQCKTSHVPIQSLETSSLTHFILISLPPDDASQDLAYDSGDVTVEAIVYKSGRRQRWGRPLEHGESAPTTGSAEEQ
jgi:hypothetical protein